MAVDVTWPGWADGIVSMLADGRVVPVDQLVERAGVRRGEVLTFLQQRPRLLETGSGWVDAFRLADGVEFTHVLSAVERETGVLAADDDLALWAVLAQEGLPLAAGGQVWAHPLPELPSRIRSHLPSGSGLIGQGLVGPDGWLAGFQAGDLLAVGLHDGVLAVRTAQPPQYRGERVAALYAACAAALERATRSYRDGDGEIPAADLTEVLAEVLVTQPDVLADPLPPIGRLLRPMGWETFGGRVGVAGTAWNRTSVKHLNRPDALIAMTSLGMLLTCSESHPDDGAQPEGEPAIGTLTRALAIPGVLGYLADEVERRTATAGASFTAVLERLAAATLTPTQRAAAALLMARAAEGAGDSDRAQLLINQALADQPDLQPALMDAAEYAACRGELRTAEGYLRRVDHPLADPLRSAIRSVLDAPAVPGQPARNRPCPCGSGRKYKMCCQATAVAPLDARAEVLYALLSTFAQRAFLTEPLGLLINRCGGDLNAALLCIDLLLTHEGAPDRFLQARGSWLRDDERRLIEAWAKIPVGAFEIREVRPGTGVTVRLLPSGESIVLADRKFSSCVHRLDLFCGRILPKQTRRQVLGMPAPVARHRRRGLLDLLAGDPTADQIAAFLGPQPAPRLVNSDGHEYLDAQLVVQVPGDAETAWQRLATHLVRIDRDILERHDERDGKTVALGRVTRTGGQWTLSANSGERLAALESLVRTEVAGAREVSRRAERLGSPPPRDGRLVRTLTIDNYLVSGSDNPDDQRPMDHLLHATRQSWVDETIDVLGMRPRQAADAGGTARAELEAVLDDMQWTNDRYRDQGKPPTMDVAWIRDELGTPA